MYELQSWLNELGIGYINLDSIITAFTHSSYKGMGYDVEDYERLEFLGDSVLDLINAEILFNDENRLTEEEMTESRKNYVSDAQLSVLFDQLNMKQFMRTANKFTLTTDVKADVVEAIFGAVFTEKGYIECYDLWITIMNKISTISSIIKDPSTQVMDWLQSYSPYQPQSKNAKSTLQEFCQGNQLGIPEYHLENKSGSEHDPTFTIELIIMPGKNKILYEDIFETYIIDSHHISVLGYGKRKKEAEMNAAERMCDIIGIMYSPSLTD